MQGIESVPIIMTENKLKRKGLPKLLSDLEQEVKVMVTGKGCS